MYFLKSNFRTWTIKLFVAVVYKIKNLVIIEIILSNVTHHSLIFLYCLVIYIKEDNFIPYWPVPSEYSIPTPEPVQKQG